MDLDREAGIAYRRGDYDLAARIVREARDLEPDRIELWGQREATIKLAESQRTPLKELLERRHSRAGILPDDLKQWTAHNRRLGIEMEP
jgi:hypothetical protein